MSKVYEDEDLKRCRECEFYDSEDNRCTAFECWEMGFLDSCPPLPCEQDD